MTKRRCWRCQNDLVKGKRLCPVCGAYNRLTEKVVDEWVIVCHKCSKATALVNGRIPGLCRCGSILSKSKDEVMKREEFLKRQRQDNEKKNLDESEKMIQTKDRPSPATRDGRELVLECINERKSITLRAAGDEDTFLLGRGGDVDPEFFKKYQYNSLSDIPIVIEYRHVGWYLKANTDGEVIVPYSEKENEPFPKDFSYRVSDGDCFFIRKRLGFEIRIGKES